MEATKLSLFSKLSLTDESPEWFSGATFEFSGGPPITFSPHAKSLLHFSAGPPVEVAFRKRSLTQAT
jgi:hypothetical protein